MQGVVDECPHDFIEVGVEAALRTKHRKVGIFTANGTHISMLHSATGLPTVESLKFHPMQVQFSFPMVRLYRTPTPKLPFSMARHQPSTQ
jgi:hypothetical protein